MYITTKKFLMLVLSPSIFTLASISVLTSVLGYSYIAYANSLPLQHPLSIQSLKGPAINDFSLKAEIIFRGIRFPTSMAFLGSSDIWS
jgi:hypothetical protein